jgi:hypothetical protein
MGLEKLNSIFNEGVGTKLVDYFQNPPKGFTVMNRTSDSQLAPGGEMIQPTKMLDTFSQPDTFNDGIPFQQNFTNLDQTQVPGIDTDIFDSTVSVYGIGGAYGLGNGTVDFFDGMSNSYYPQLESPILGFTLNYNKGGYTYEEGAAGNSHFLDVTRNGDLISSNILTNIQPDSLFSTPYSDVFRTIQDGNLDNIIDSGNMAFDGTSRTSGVGYQNIKPILDKFNATKIITPDTYELNGQINTENTDWFYNGSSTGILNSDSVDTLTEVPKRTTKLVFGDVFKGNLESMNQFSTLYGNDQTVSDLKVGGSRLNLNPGGFQLLHQSGFRGDEPYHISKMRSTDIKDYLGRELPVLRSVIDLKRIGKFLVSQAGLLFIAKQNLLGLNSKIVFKKSVKAKIPGINLGPSVKLTSVQRRAFYNPLSTAAAAVRAVGDGAPNALVERDFPVPGVPGIESEINYAGRDSTSTTDIEMAFDFKSSTLEAFNSVMTSLLGDTLGTLATDAPFGYPGDFMTLTEITNAVGKQAFQTGGSKVGAGAGSTLAKAHPTDEGTSKKISNPKVGMPFYFKDLRDNTYLIFRGYITGLTENLSPTWESINYIGRSEPVYIYQHSERDVSFTLRLFAHTQSELSAIYTKVNRLTSLCYPQYKADDKGTFRDTDNGVGKVRMKPPLTKFRLGDLFGKTDNEMTGFIKSLSYNFPDNSPWETENGYQVPKLVEATITYQVIHSTTPQLVGPSDSVYSFYGTE